MLVAGNDVRRACVGLASGVSKNTKGILAFLAISFGIAWGGMFGARLGFGLSLVNPLVQLPFAFSPAVAAIIVRKWVTREGFADAGLRLHWRGNIRWYVVSWLAPLVLAAVTVAIAAVIGVWHFDLSPLDQVIPGMPGWAFVTVLMLVIPLLAPIYWGEEFGWTSYLRLRLWTDRPALSVIGTGLIWAVWHYPLAFLGYIEFTNVTLGLLVWTVSFQFQEILLAWLRVRTGSIWPTSIAHAGNNMVLSLLTGILLQESGKLDIMTVMLISTVALAAASLLIVLNRRLRRDLSCPATPERTPTMAK